MTFSAQMLAPAKLKSTQSQHAKPSFIGLGTPKAGTSWWFSLLESHPNVDVNNFGVKETCYFCHYWSEDKNKQMIRDYERGFYSSDDSFKGEWSTLYFSHPFALKRVIEHYPGVKKLIAFRNPLDCFYSWVNQVLRNRYKHMVLDNQDAHFMYLNYDLIPSIFSQITSYPDKLAWLQKASKKNLLILQYEANCVNFKQQFSRTLSFLELDSFVPESPDIPVNKAFENLAEAVKLPQSSIDELYRTRDKLLNLCPDFDPALWV